MCKSTGVAILIGLLLAGCGGGGKTSSGAGGASDNPAGAYSGNMTANISIGANKTTTGGLIDIVIHEDGSVVSDPGTYFQGNGRLTGNQVVIDVPNSSLSEPGLACAGTIRLTGTWQGNQIAGQVQGINLSCNGVPIFMTGTFLVTRNGGSVSVLGSGFRAMERIAERLSEF
jgi:hypothetical protein